MTGYCRLECSGAVRFAFLGGPVHFKGGNNEEVGGVLECVPSAWRCCEMQKKGSTSGVQNAVIFDSKRKRNVTVEGLIIGKSTCLQSLADFTR